MSLELDPLLQPISADELCGDDYSFSNDFHEIKKAKTEDDPLLDLGDWVAEPKQADWHFVESKSIDLLTHKTKDIRLLTWLSEAWTNIYGFEGVAKSLELSHRMLEEYWLKIHPEIEDDDLDQRLGLLQGLTSQLPNLIKKIPLLNSQPYYSLFDYEKILYRQNNRLKNSDESDQTNISSDLEQFEKVKGESETLAGLCIELFSRIPHAGEEIVCEPFVFKIQSVDTRRIKKIKVSLNSNTLPTESDEKTV